MRLAETVTFGGSGLDRAAEDRAASDRLKPDAQWIAFWHGKPLLAGGAALARLEPGQGPLADHLDQTVFLGRDDGQPVFAADVSSWTPAEMPQTLGAFVDTSVQPFPGLPDDHGFTELRSAMARLSARDAELAASAKAVLDWHRSHRFCARCGSESRPAEGGWQRVCPDCGGHHFPRTDPVVIMLITHGSDVLLGRSPGWPEGMFSLLAGFVEPGEPIEAAVRREVFEETRVRVGRVGYLASQPWPFPTSLMIGCHGVAETREITLDPRELDAAHWVPREELLAMIAGESHAMKPARQGSIARFLLTHWLADRLD